MRLRDFHEFGDMGPTELASKIGISKGYAHALLNGSKRAGPRTAQRLAKLTGRPWHEFIAVEKNTDAQSCGAIP